MADEGQHKDNADSVGAVNIEEIYLRTADNRYFNLSNFVQQIIIYENIGQACLTGSLGIADSTNAIGNLRLYGKEIVTMKIKSPFLEDSEAIYRSFMAYSITDRIQQGDRQQFFKLNFISLEGAKDVSTRLSKKFSGSTEEIAAEIYNEILSEPRIYDKDGKATSVRTNLVIGGKPHKTNNFAFVANNWSAIETLNFVAKNTEPADVNDKHVLPNALFFERREEFYFGSLTDYVLTQKNKNLIYDEYNFMPALDGKFNQNEERLTYGSYNYISPFISRQYCVPSTSSFAEHFNELKNQRTGYYGNHTIGIDMLNRLNYQMIFDYVGKLQDVNQNNVVDKQWTQFAHISDKRPGPDNPIYSPQAVQQVKVGASNLFDSDEFGYDMEYFEMSALRRTALAELKRLKVIITVPGKTDVQVGYMVRLNYPSVGEKLSGVTSEDTLDPAVSGLYAISGIVHNITPQNHTMKLELIRDSFGDD